MRPFTTQVFSYWFQIALLKNIQFAQTIFQPIAARSCHHLPQCIPPSAGFPYLMPCYWPARPSAPCSTPTRCFHNPPCPAPRRRRGPPDPDADTCTKVGQIMLFSENFSYFISASLAAFINVS